MPSTYIYKQPKTGHYTIRFRNFCGKLQTLTRKTKREILDIRRHIESRSVFAYSRMLTSEVCEQFVQTKNGRVSQGRLRTIKRVLTDFSELIQLRICEITSESINEYVLHRMQCRGQKQKSVAPGTINKELRIINELMRYAIEENLISRKPRIRFLKVEPKDKQWLSPNEIRRIYAVADEFWQDLIVFSLFSCWRIGSIMQLRWEDVRFDQKIENRMSGQHEVWSIIRLRGETAKNRKPVLLYCHPTLEACLKRRCDRMEPSDGQTPVFDPRAHSTLLDQWYKLQRRAGVQAHSGDLYTLHDLTKRTSLNLNRHLDSDDLRQLGQHASLATTDKHYLDQQIRGDTVLKLYDPFAA